MAMLALHPNSTTRLGWAVSLPTITLPPTQMDQQGHYFFHLPFGSSSSTPDAVRPTDFLLRCVARGYVRRKPIHVDLQAVSISARQPSSAPVWHEGSHRPCYYYYHYHDNADGTLTCIPRPPAYTTIDKGPAAHPLPFPGSLLFFFRGAPGFGFLARSPSTLRPFHAPGNIKDQSATNSLVALAGPFGIWEFYSTFYQKVIFHHSACGP